MKEYKITEEIMELFDEVDQLSILRDKCVESFFKTRKAIYYAKRAAKAQRKAWKLVFELYPELPENAAYRMGKDFVYIKD